MVTPFDEYPVHQTSWPVSRPATGDPDHTDRTSFFGADTDRGIAFAVTIAMYPNRQVIDGAVTLLIDGIQRSVFASGRIPLDRRQTRVGPIRLETVEPLRTMRIVVVAPEHGIEGELVFHARTPVIERVRPLTGALDRPMVDATHFEQLGEWSGVLRLWGGSEPTPRRLELSPWNTVGTRDRAWGTHRPDEPVGGSPVSPVGVGPMFFLKASANFGDHGLSFTVREHTDGRRWFSAGARVGMLRGEQALFGVAGAVEHLRSFDHALELIPGTRRARAVTVTFVPERGRSPETLVFEPVTALPMSGLGSLHPTRFPGCWHGEASVAGEQTVVADVDPQSASAIHQLIACRVVDGRGRAGTGVIEQLVLGPHALLGLIGLTSGHVPSEPA